MAAIPPASMSQSSGCAPITMILLFSCAERVKRKEINNVNNKIFFMAIV
jgi:hypothetical protein